MARPIVLIPHLFRLAGAFNFRNNYSPPLIRHLDPTPSKQIEKLQIQRSGYLLLTLKQEDHAHTSKSKTFMSILVKNIRNNEEKGGERCLLE